MLSANATDGPLQLAGMSLQLDTVVGTAVAALIVLTVGLIAARRPRFSRPGRLQVVWESALATADRAVETGPAWARRRIVALALTVFSFVVAANWLHLLPGVSLPAPTSDLNLTLAIALIVIGTVHVTALRVRGVRGYLRHYLHPWWLLPVKVFEELLKPVTLALRLFGMAFASALMLVLIGELLPPPVAVVPHALWTLFDLFIGVIQAFIFALLTLLYYRAALPPVAVPPAEIPATKARPADARPAEVAPHRTMTGDATAAPRSRRERTRPRAHDEQFPGARRHAGDRTGGVPAGVRGRRQVRAAAAETNGRGAAGLGGCRADRGRGR